MSRTPRHQQVVPGLPHHVIVRGNNRRNLFSNNDDRLRFLRLMERSPHKAECALAAIALMTNHVHLIVTPDSVTGLSKWMQSFEQPYAQCRNRLLGASGKLFEQRFEGEPIDTIPRLAATTAYVDLNPARIGRASTWTTFALHTGGKTHSLLRDLWTPSPWWLSLGADDATRQLAYRDFALSRMEAWERDVVYPRRAVQRATYAVRPVRPDGARVAEKEGPYRP